MKVQYYLHGDKEELYDLKGDCYDTDIKYPKYLAEIAAENAWDDEDMYECREGFTIGIVVDGKDFGSYNIKIDYDPRFHAAKI